MAKREQAMLNGGHGDLKMQGPTKEVRTRAGANCGSSSHRARDASCMALDIVCRGCHISGHMAAFCRKSHLPYDLKWPH